MYEEMDLATFVERVADPNGDNIDCFGAVEALIQQRNVELLEELFYRLRARRDVGAVSPRLYSLTNVIVWGLASSPGVRSAVASVAVASTAWTHPALGVQGIVPRLAQWQPEWVIEELLATSEDLDFTARLAHEAVLRDKLASWVPIGATVTDNLHRADTR